MLRNVVWYLLWMIVDSLAIGYGVERDSRMRPFVCSNTSHPQRSRSLGTIVVLIGELPSGLTHFPHSREYQTVTSESCHSVHCRAKHPVNSGIKNLYLMIPGICIFLVDFRHIS